MVNRSHQKLILIIVALLLQATTFAHAYSIAILPVADLSKGRNGVDLQITTLLAQRLTNQKISVIDGEKVMTFMVDHAIRRCGELDTLTCRIMANNLDCDTILVTTILGNQDNNSELSLITTLYDGKTGQGIWSTLFTRHLSDDQPLFGIGKSLDLSEIKKDLCHELTAYFVEKSTTLPKTSSELIHDYRVAEIQITPELVRGDSKLHCRLKIQFFDQAPEYLQLSTGDQTVILQRNTTQHVYEGILHALASDGSHSVNLKIYWNASHQETVPEVSTYQVANYPSELEMRTCSGLELGDMYAFSDSVKLIPTLNPTRPIDCWQLTITNEYGKCVVSEKHITPLPKQLQWRGIDNNRRRLDMGRYEMVLKIWDLAGNIAETSSTLYLQPKETDLVSISQNFNSDNHQIELLPAKNIMIPIEHWAITLETGDGDIVYTTQGEHLPALVDLPPQLNYDELSCSVRVLDQLGNHSLITGTRFQVDNTNEMLAQRSDLNWSADF
ncbi:MAG: hypothetical protein BA874_04745 [Desulfuromonadales bacterium C00003068]|jgi:hypothetical protein|nr:MAG: hypothetical protein BA874_04745 [Desulfuromonadales bacterium C00003068]